MLRHSLTPSSSLRISQVSTRVHALNHLVKIKMATGEYAAAWDARNAANKLRERERISAEERTFDAPESTLATSQLLARHDQEARDLRTTQRVRAARLEREIQNEIERRGYGIIQPRDPTEGGGGGEMSRWLAERDASTEHQTQWMQREAARTGTMPPAPMMLPPDVMMLPPDVDTRGGHLRTPGEEVPAAPFHHAFPVGVPVRRPSALSSFLIAAGDTIPAEYATETTLGAGGAMAQTLGAYARDEPEADEPEPTPTPVASPSPRPQPVHRVNSQTTTAVVDREEYVFGRRRTWTRAPVAPEDHRGSPTLGPLPPRSLPPSLLALSVGAPGDDDDDADAAKLLAARARPSVPPLDFRAVLREADARSTTHARVRDLHTRAAAVRGYGEYRDATKSGRTRGFTTGHDEAARGSIERAKAPWGSGQAATDGDRFLRAGERENDGLAASTHSSDLSSDGTASDTTDDGEVWTAPPTRLREAMTGGGGEAGAQSMRRVARRGGPGLDVEVARVFRGDAAAEETREAAEGKENVHRGGGGGGAKGRVPTGVFFAERRGPKSHGASLPSNAADHTVTRVRT